MYVLHVIYNAFVFFFTKYLYCQELSGILYILYIVYIVLENFDF